MPACHDGAHVQWFAGGGEQVMTFIVIALVMQIWVLTPCVWMTQMHNEELRRDHDEPSGTASP
jgi:hypothetical protein